MEFKTLTIVLALLTIATVCRGSGYRQMDFDNGNFKVSWMYDNGTDYLNFRLEVKTTGWVGFGFALKAPNNMKDYDVVVGGVTDNGESYLNVSFESYVCRNYKEMG